MLVFEAGDVLKRVAKHGDLGPEQCLPGIHRIRTFAHGDSLLSATDGPVHVGGCKDRGGGWGRRIFPLRPQVTKSCSNRASHVFEVIEGDAPRLVIPANRATASCDSPDDRAPQERRRTSKAQSFPASPERIEGRLQRLEAGPLPCTKSVLQSHSAEAATANNFCSMNV